MWAADIQELGVPAQHQAHTTQGSRFKKSSPHDFGCKNQWVLRPRKTEASRVPENSSYRAHTWIYLDSLPLSSSMEVAETYGKELNCLASGLELEGLLSPRQKCWQRPLFLWWVFPTQSQQAGTISESPSTCLILFAPPWWFPGALTHPKFFGPPKLFSVAFLYIWLVLAHASDFTKLSPTISILLLLSGPRPGTISSQPCFTAWPYLGTSMPTTSAAAICRSLCSSYWVTPGRTQMMADLGLHLLGSPRASTPSV